MIGWDARRVGSRSHDSHNDECVTAIIPRRYRLREPPIGPHTELTGMVFLLSWRNGVFVGGDVAGVS